MKQFKIKRIKEQKIIGSKIRKYIDFTILGCCLIIAFNIHPTNTSENLNVTQKSKMIFIFHDYEGNQYVMNDNIHGTSSYWDYLFEDDVPDDLKGDDIEFSEGTSLENLTNEDNDKYENSSVQSGDNTENSDSVKDNQISIENIMSDLGFDGNNTNSNTNGEEKDSDYNKLEINISDEDIDSNEGPYYAINEEDSSLIIEKIENSPEEQEKEDSGKETNNEQNKKPSNQSDNNLSIAKAFTFIEDGRVLPTLIAWNDLQFGNFNENMNYKNIKSNSYSYKANSENKQGGITIIEDYDDCNTPRGYKIKHGESVLAYKQMDDTPDICNIERRFCWKGKLSGTYTQQGCSVNKNYTYESFGSNDTNYSYDYDTSPKINESNGNSKENQEESIKIAKEETEGSFVFDRPNYTKSDFNSGNNLKAEDQEMQQTKRSHFDCTAPRGEKVKHGQFIQAFKHANGFYDAPCEMQIRVCSDGELLGTYKESTCKTRDTSFIDRVNGSPTRQTYSKEKLERVKKQIANEQTYYEETRKNATRSTDSIDLDKILFILDQD